MYILAGIVLALLGGIGLLTSPTPDGPVKDIDTGIYWVLIAGGVILLAIGLFKPGKKRH